MGRAVKRSKVAPKGMRAFHLAYTEIRQTLSGELDALAAISKHLPLP